MMLDAFSGISSANRLTFCQSIASSRSNVSPSVSSGWFASRTSAAASPPRICGPLVRTMIPYSPAFAAALRRSVPAVITPLPPLPASAIERLDSVSRHRGTSAREASAVAVASTSSRLPEFTFRQVDRLRAGFGLMQIKAFAIGLLHHVGINAYCGTVIPE